MSQFGTSPATVDSVAAAIAANESPSSNYVPGALAETIPAWAASTAVTPTSGDLYIWAVHLGADESIGHVGFVTTTTAGATLNHWWTLVADDTLTVQACSADQTSGAIAASTWFSLAMSTAYVTTYSGLYYLGVMISDNSGTQPTLCGSSAGPLVAMLTGAGHPVAMLGGQSNTGATAALAQGTVLTTPTATADIPYLYATN
jgi:hypothetical protein